MPQHVCHHQPRMSSRRSFLSDMGMGFTGVALAAMLQRDGVAKSIASGANQRLGEPHFAPKAKRVIWMMMRGGVSHFESFDPKPALQRYGGKTIPETPYADEVLDSPFLSKLREQGGNNVIKSHQAKILPMQVGYRPGGQSGAN